ncbi:hypothetical protein DFR58_116119 [Anaerobacterium chartisolvens]|uniref:Uncharacterized protein n=1 Tax=Anaerobacterium chartisolvens TaxID=1297424 RepID=A0A369AXI8_9FIRM|nr:hypothetical protein [Anaerobacterium chartisolvens]RCX13883.1 hypothetical protein DFR58_116119 [Anaerobacterium chartisolvens]
MEADPSEWGDDAKSVPPEYNGSKNVFLWGMVNAGWTSALSSKDKEKHFKG